jgi:hypothetical protein
MISRFAWIAVLVLAPALVWAQDEKEPADAAASAGTGMAEPPATDVGLETAPPMVAPDEEQPASKDRIDTAADAGQMPAGHGDAGMVGGHEGSVIQGGGAVMPDGTNAPVPIGGGAAIGELAGFDVDLHGFALAEGLVEVFDNDEYEVTFLPRELELDLEAAHDAGALLRLDLNLMTSPEGNTFSSFDGEDLFDGLVEQVYVEWTRGKLKVRGGKFDAPFGVEPLDPHERIDLSRSTVSKLATPDLFTGFYASYAVMPMLDAYVIAVNGWDLSVDHNRSKTLGGGVPHRLGELPTGDYLYEGDLSFVAGAERVGVNDLRWLLDYSARLHLPGGVGLALELARGQEDGEGFNQRGMKDGIHAADWWGGLVTVEYERKKTGAESLTGLAAALRVEYVHDHDLAIGLPNRPNLPNLTTLLGVAPTLRYELAPGIQVVAEYGVDFERGDVENVSVQRDGSNNPFEWFITQEVVLGLLGWF